jgi:hypothetical protein
MGQSPRREGGSVPWPTQNPLSYWTEQTHQSIGPQQQVQYYLPIQQTIPQRKWEYLHSPGLEGIRLGVLILIHPPSTGWVGKEY